jgi:Tfp pilus assembly protein PilF
MQLSKVKFTLFIFGMLIVGVFLGAFAQQSLTATLGGTACEAKIAEAGQALDRNDFARAEELSFEAIPLDPENYLPYQELGEVFSRRNETAAAIGAYSRAVDKLTAGKGHYRLLQLDTTMRQTELSQLHEKIAKLKARA